MPSLWSNRIKLIKEQQCWGCCCSCKDITYLLSKPTNPITNCHFCLMQQSIYISFRLHCSVSHGIAIYSLMQSLDQCTSLYKYPQSPCNYREKGTRDLTPCSKAPMYLFSSSGPFTETKHREHAALVTTSIWVLPHPGGPYKRTLERSLKGALAKSSPCLIGITNICYTNSQVLRLQHESI